MTKIAYDQVRVYGMSEAIGPISFPPQGGDERAAGFQNKPYSKAQQALFDRESSNVITAAHEQAVQLLKDNRDKLDKLARELHKNETLTYEDVKRLIGPPPHGPKSVIELADPAVMFPKPMGADDS